MAEYGSGGAIGQAATARTMSRIESDVELVKSMTEQVEFMMDQIIRHARTLGYFEPTPTKEATVAPIPVITTLADALQRLSRVIDSCSGSLNVFG
jgi:hypothetical protein